MLRNNVIEAKRAKDVKPNPVVYEISGLSFENNVVNGKELK